MIHNTPKYRKFTSLLLQWDKKVNTRQMPWKGEKDPYKIWLSEIILQQTRVEQGLDYYKKFITRYPSIHHLSRAKDKDVYKLWEGLGYYNRCKNLVETARHISSHYQGRFPDSFEELLALKGVGTYTASAIASFAFNQAYAVVDGNVTRVLSRIFAIQEPVYTSRGKKVFLELAATLIDPKRPALYNQAIMDFGAVVCKPANPLCKTCVFNKHCLAYQKGKVDQFPVKARKKTTRQRWFYYLILEQNGKLYISKRKRGDIWENLYDFPLIESAVTLTPGRILKKDGFRTFSGGKHTKPVKISGIYTQQLSHQEIKARFIRIRIHRKPANADLIAVRKKELPDYPFPRIIRRYLDDEYMMH